MFWFITDLKDKRLLLFILNKGEREKDRKERKRKRGKKEEKIEEGEKHGKK